MGKIVAIGGGEIGRPGYPIETTEIDKRILELTGKRKPVVLLLPTASGDSPLYWQAFSQHFGRGLGCKAELLHLVDRNSSGPAEIVDKIFGANAVYVGGGNIARMMRIWRARGVDQVLKEAYGRGVVMSGLSAGAICWFRYGNSDSRKDRNPEAGLIRVSGLRLVNAALCPHYNVEEDRKPGLREMMRRTPGVAVALDNCCAIEIVDGRYKIVTSRAGAGAYRVFWSCGKCIEEAIPAHGSLDALTKKHAT